MRFRLLFALVCGIGLSVGTAQGQGLLDNARREIREAPDDDPPKPRRTDDDDSSSGDCRHSSFVGEIGRAHV